MGKKRGKNLSARFNGRKTAKGRRKNNKKADNEMETISIEKYNKQKNEERSFWKQKRQEKHEKTKNRLHSSKMFTSMEDFALNAKFATSAYQKSRELDSKISSSAELKQYAKHLHRVVRECDVVLEVVDARDPEGCRSLTVEDSIRSHGKKVIIVLNKVDLVPRSVIQRWIEYYESIKTKVIAVTSKARGNVELLKRIKAFTYFRTTDRKRARKPVLVGFVGYPNVGKSSLINSLRRKKVVSTSSTAGWTKTTSEIVLDRYVRFMDSPGIVLDEDASVDVVLRNAMRIESIPNPEQIAGSLLERCPDLVYHYYPEYDGGEFELEELLSDLARRRGFIEKGYLVNIQKSAQLILKDWCAGRIKFFAEPAEPADSIMAEDNEVYGARLVKKEEVEDDKQVKSIYTRVITDYVIMNSGKREEMQREGTQYNVSDIDPSQQIGRHRRKEQRKNRRTYEEKMEEAHLRDMEAMKKDEEDEDEENDGTLGLRAMVSEGMHDVVLYPENNPFSALTVIEDHDLEEEQEDDEVTDEVESFVYNEEEEEDFSDWDSDALEEML
ncbi:hypothetical protein PCE1_003094 [Barthelona sp. PCE]